MIIAYHYHHTCHRWRRNIFLIRVTFIMIPMFAILVRETIIVVMTLELTTKDWLKDQDLSSLILILIFVAVEPAIARSTIRYQHHHSHRWSRIFHGFQLSSLWFHPCLRRISAPACESARSSVLELNSAVVSATNFAQEHSEGFGGMQVATHRCWPLSQKSLVCSCIV